MRPAEDRNWYVLYTHSRSEKKVNNRLRDLGVESFLPLQKVKRQWSTRVKLVEAPLFTGYLFVYTQEKALVSLTQIPGIVQFISFGGKPAIVSEQEIRFMRNMLQQQIDLRLEGKHWQEGRRVRLAKAPFTGLEGLLKKCQNNYRLMIEIDGLHQIISVEIPKSYWPFLEQC